MKVTSSYERNEYQIRTDFGRVWFKGYKVWSNGEVALIGESGDLVGTVKPSKAEEFLLQVEDR